MSCISISELQAKYQDASTHIKNMCDGQLCKIDTIASEIKKIYPEFSTADITSILNRGDYLFLKPETEITEGDIIYYIIDPPCWKKLLGIKEYGAVIRKVYRAMTTEYHSYVTYLPYKKRNGQLIRLIERRLPKEVKETMPSTPDDIFRYNKHKLNTVCYVHDDGVYYIDTECIHSDYVKVYLGKRC